jgi:hypothetical protein
MRALTRQAAEPESRTRRRKGEETGRGFKRATVILLERITRNPLLHSLNPTWDTFTWLHVWEYNNAAGTPFQHDCSATVPSPTSEPAPRL